VLGATRTAVVVLVLSVVAVVVITFLHRRVESDLVAREQVSDALRALSRLQGDAVRSQTPTGGTADRVRACMGVNVGRIDRALHELEAHDPPAGLDDARLQIATNHAINEAILQLTSAASSGGQAPPDLVGLFRAADATEVAARTVLTRAADVYSSRARRSQAVAASGSAAMLLLLGGAFGLLLLRTRSQERRASRSEREFRELVENIPCAVYRRRVGDGWPMEFVSDRMRDITGHPAAAFLDGRRSFAGLLTDDDRRAVDAHLASLEDSGGTLVTRYPIAHADGGVRWVMDEGHPVRDDDGRVVRVDGTLSDITALVALERERERIEQELRLTQRLDSIGQLASGIAHEINTPVQFVGDSITFVGDAWGDADALIARLEALALEDATDERRAHVRDAAEDADLEYLRERVPAALGRVHDGLGRVGAIVGAMRTFGRPPQVEHAPADLNEALRSTFVVAQNEYKYAAELEADLDELPAVVCNIGELNQVFLNLIVNAAHAIADTTGGGGAARGTISVRTRREADEVVVTVADTGGGIPAEVRDRIFDPFFTTKGVGKGTGQGLAISRSIVVDGHRGSLAVDSAPGRGTTFTVRLPLHPVPVAHA
jgi:PAS domain S-box-containing protein